MELKQAERITIITAGLNNYYPFIILYFGLFSKKPSCLDLLLRLAVLSGQALFKYRKVAAVPVPETTARVVPAPGSVPHFLFRAAPAP